MTVDTSVRALPTHLTERDTHGGVRMMPTIPGTLPVIVFESRRQENPGVWLNLGVTSSHLTVAAAVHLAEQLLYLAEHHSDATPTHA